MCLAFAIHFVSAGLVGIPQCINELPCYIDPCSIQRCSANTTCIVNCGDCSAVCVPTPSCDNSCPRIYRPVCGSNRISYNSFCQLKNAQCRDNSIKLSSYGRCLSCSNWCPRVYKPVCG